MAGRRGGAVSTPQQPLGELQGPVTRDVDREFMALGAIATCQA